MTHHLFPITHTAQTEEMEAQPEVAAAAQQEEKADVSSVLLRRLEMGTVDAEQLIKQVGDDVYVRCCTAAPDPIPTITT